MRLKNKRTGEIGELQVTEKHCAVAVGNGTASCGLEIYSSLARLNEEWEDYEEPKSINEVDVALDAIGEYCNEHSYYSGDSEKIKILNTVEEKLKAIKRLKDKGFRFKGWESYEETSRLSFPDNHIVNSYTAIFDFNKPCRKHEIEKGVKADLDLLFGGEE